MTAVLLESTLSAPQRSVPELLAELEAVGDVDMIAGLFEAEGILGTPCNAGMCAVAIYLQRHSDVDEVNVGTHEATVWRPAEEDDLRWPLGPLVTSFVSEFDMGSYPELFWPEFRERYQAELEAEAEMVAEVA